MDLQFDPKFEFISSLHSYICRKSHKKLDLTPTWAQGVKKKLTPELSGILDEMEVNADWKLAYLLIVLSTHAKSPEEVIAWLESLSSGDLYELFAPYGNQFPDHMGEFHAKMIKVFTGWNEQYFNNSDPVILSALTRHVTERKAEQLKIPQDMFIDDTTNGLVFEPVEGIETLLLVPQYHFQPVNVIFQYGRVLFCHYCSRLDLSGDTFMSLHDYRMIRSLAEKSRLKILRYLQEGPRSFIEIVRELKLSKGITHDHISKLRSAGLIYAHVQGETITEYSLRIKALGQIQDKLLDYIEHRS
nr:winged helix-turn-helix domain-containing protein [Paenibacillus caui]